MHHYKKSKQNTILSQLQIRIMRVGFVIVIFSSLAFGQNCPEILPTECGPNEMVCGGGIDAEGCPVADTCIPNTGKYHKCINTGHPILVPRPLENKGKSIFISPNIYAN